MNSAMLSDVYINPEKKSVETLWKDGHRSIYHVTWLRFNCRCKVCKRTVIGELNIHRSQFPSDLRIKDARLTKNGSFLELEIIGEVVDGHVINIDSGWLKSACYCDQCLHEMLQERTLHFVDPTKVEVPKIDYNELDTQEGMLNWMKQVIDIGFVVIQNVPLEEGACIKVGEKISPVLQNTYGKLFDVLDNQSTENIANSQIWLPLHTDQCHYEAGPGVQLLHAIQFDDCVQGGESLLVDMFYVLETFRKEFPEDFNILSKVPVPFGTIDYQRKNPCYLYTRKPVIVTDYDDQIVGFNFNKGIEEPLRIHAKYVEKFYQAYNKLDRMINRNEFVFKHRLRTGELLFFNNRRMLHSREAYMSNGGRRRLQGCYISMEELRSKYVVCARLMGNLDVVAPKIGNGSAV
uniref:Gamma-butyrobetaine dioxygenase n=1 Tax=Ciona intestinalis TaxID=7719 RepID=F6V8N0_CIOIN|nr:uncharacterized protein LOC100177042 isoform X1 [Ciona intestinalis]|eukprot:XP_002119838.1 uncharacterized protein LOC100177042 isoform X1 [Ciona intestinalis]